VFVQQKAQQSGLQESAQHSQQQGNYPLLLARI
jgi:hypothetical protein